MFEKLLDLFSNVNLAGIAKTKKSTTEIAKEVLAGKWSNGDKRRAKLIKAGYNYNAVQKKVNELIIDKVAHEVIAGKWGAGQARKNKLTKAGYNYAKVQKRVGEILDQEAAKKKATATKTTTSKQGYSGKFPDYKLVKTNAQVIADTIKWAKWIAGDNRFHYGYGKHSHHNGCFFCGTQKLKQGHGIKNPNYTYCCNPFIGAAWAHGGGDATAYKKCHNCDSWDFGTGNGSYHTSSLFDKVSLKSLKAGDVLCSDSHVALYIGNGKVVQAGHEDDNKENSKSWNTSINVDTWNGYKRAYRYNGKVSADRPLSHGEVSDRVTLWQNYLNWYTDGKFFKECGGADGCYGDNTLKYTKQFQEKEMGKGQGDGIVGQKTINAAKNIKK